FSRRSCFVLTEVGVTLATQICREVTPAFPLLRMDQPPAKPQWDRDCQRLLFGGLIVKQFKVPAPNQELILCAFEEEHWPARIDDPLPRQASLDPKRRLHETITSLNRHQRNPLLRFLGDGSGQGVRWEPALSPISSHRNARSVQEASGPSAHFAQTQQSEKLL